jgi:hypothetical protein
VRPCGGGAGLLLLAGCCEEGAADKAAANKVWANKAAANKDCKVARRCGAVVAKVG